MSNVPHELAEEFPEHVDTIHRLKTENAHFAKLFDAYHDINRAVHRAETNVEPTDDANMESMRKQRMHLKDELYGMLSAAN
ncbi:MAG: YdcH family protein [Pseudomonadota bacterium]